MWQAKPPGSERSPKLLSLAQGLNRVSRSVVPFRHSWIIPDQCLYPHTGTLIIKLPTATSRQCSCLECTEYKLFQLATLSVSWLTDHNLLPSLQVEFHMVSLQVSMLLLVIVVLVGYICWLQQETLVQLRVRIAAGVFKMVSWTSQRRSSQRRLHTVVDIHRDSVLELRNNLLANQGERCW